MPAPTDPAPLTAAEADLCLGPILSADRTLLLAVSGGVDSMVLMHLAADVRRRLGSGARFVIATVNHGLRPGSADDAAFVSAHAGQLGLACEVLTWSAPKPATGVAAAARMARYELLAAACNRHGATAVVTAHTSDDQAETLIMRLARGSGLDGLAAMSDCSILRMPTGAQLQVLRPLLGISKARLVATALDRCIQWRQDPSNDNDAFERVRARKALAVLEDLGVTTAALARSARRLGCAQNVVRMETVKALIDPAVLRLDALGFCVLSKAPWVALPVEIRIRVLGAVIRHVGGLDGYQSRAQLEAIESRICGGRSASSAVVQTYARTKIVAAHGSIRVQRETGRSPASAQIHAGETMIWDNRFRVTRFARAGSSGGEPLTVRHLGPAGLKQVKDQCLVGYPAEVLHAVPAFWSGDDVVSAPPLGLARGETEPIDTVGSMWFRTRDELIDGIGRNEVRE